MKTKLLALAILLTTLTSCVSFDRKLIKDDLTKISENNGKSIEGKYAFKGYDNSSSLISKPVESIGIARMLDLKNQGLEDCDFLEIKSKKLEPKLYELELTLFKNDTVKHSYKLNATLKNGILTLKNRTTKCTGIPYFLGGCEVSQSRIGLTADNNLVIHSYNDNNGSFLFLMWAGRTINYAEKFKRIQ